MKCKQVEELLPLYAGRDLDERSEQRVSAHVETCAKCAGAAAEYRESRQLLQEFAPPAFSDNVYAGIRQGVWREIETESKVQPLSEIIAGWFRPRFVWAAASVVLIAITALGVYFIANRSTQPQPLAGNPPKVSPSPENKQLAEQPGSDKLAAAPSTPGKRRILEQRQANDRQHRRRLDRNWALDRANTLAVNSPDAKVKKVETPATVGVVTAESEKTLRMEIQTKNPNIRIIWFSQRESKPISPHSKGI